MLPPAGGGGAGEVPVDVLGALTPPTPLAPVSPVAAIGGLVVVSTGWALLRRSDDDDSTEDAKGPCNEANYMRQAFYPLTLPLTVGPGSIAVAILESDSATWNRFVPRTPLHLSRWKRSTAKRSSEGLRPNDEP